MLIPSNINRRNRFSARCYGPLTKFIDSECENFSYRQRLAELGLRPRGAERVPPHRAQSRPPYYVTHDPCGVKR